MALRCIEMFGMGLSFRSHPHMFGLLRLGWMTISDLVHMPRKHREFQWLLPACPGFDRYLSGHQLEISVVPGAPLHGVSRTSNLSCSRWNFFGRWQLVGKTTLVLSPRCGGTWRKLMPVHLL